VSIVKGTADALREFLAPFPLLRRLTHAAGWTTLGTLIGNGLTFIAMIFVARIVGRDRFGELGILQSTVVMFQVFASVGLGMTAMKHVAEYRASEPARAGHVIAISDLVALISGSLAALVVIVLAPWLAARVLVRAGMAVLLRIAAVTIGLSALTGAMNGSLAGMEEFRSIAIINFVGGLAGFPLILAGAWWNGTVGVALAMATQALLTCVLVSLTARRKARRHHIPISLRNATEWPVLWRFSLPAMLSGIMVAPAEWLCTAMLVRHGGYSQMGYYAVATQWRNVLMFLPAMIVQSALPVLASVKSAHGPDSEEFRRLTLVSQSAIMLLILPVATLLMFLSREILRLYGAAFLSGSTVLVAVGFMVAIQSTGVGLGPAIEAWGAMWATATFQLCWAISYVLLSWLAVDRLGAAALPFAAGTAHMVLMCLNVVYFHGKLPHGIGIRIAKAMFAATAAATLCLSVPIGVRPWLALPCAVTFLILGMFYFSDRELIAGTLLRQWQTFSEARKTRDKETV